jgi:hypothetical protein
MSNQLPRRWIVSEQQQGSTGIEMPDLIRIDDVPAAELMLFEQIVDRGGRASGLLASQNAIGGTIDFPIPAAFGMGREL